MKKQMQSKLTHDYWKSYDREIYMSEYVTIPKSKYRLMIISEVISWGISVFLLLVMVLR